VGSRFIGHTLQGRGFSLLHDPQVKPQTADARLDTTVVN
jgi:hypothetical protein